jgi:hypothetical protein
VKQSLREKRDKSVPTIIFHPNFFLRGCYLEMDKQKVGAEDWNAKLLLENQAKTRK